MTAVSATFRLTVADQPTSNLAWWASRLPSGYSILINDTYQTHPKKIPTPAQGILRAPCFWGLDRVPPDSYGFGGFSGLMTYINKGWYNPLTEEVGFVGRSFGSGQYMLTFAERDDGGIGKWYGGSPTPVIQRLNTEAGLSLTDYNDPVRPRQFGYITPGGQTQYAWADWVAVGGGDPLDDAKVVGHGYDNNAIDIDTGTIWFAQPAVRKYVRGFNPETGVWWKTGEYSSATTGSITYVPGVGLLSLFPTGTNKIIVSTGQPGAGWAEVADLTSTFYEDGQYVGPGGAALSFYDRATETYWIGGGYNGGQNDQFTTHIRFWEKSELLEAIAGGGGAANLGTVLPEQPHTKWPSDPSHRWGLNLAGGNAMAIGGKIISRFKTPDSVVNSSTKPQYAIIDINSQTLSAGNSQPETPNPVEWDNVSPGYLFSGPPTDEVGIAEGRDPIVVPIDKYGVVMLIQAGSSSSYSPLEVWLWKP